MRNCSFKLVHLGWPLKPSQIAESPYAAGTAFIKRTFNRCHLTIFLHHVAAQSKFTKSYIVGAGALYCAN